jgi:serine/threonine protein kinase/Leucine-rich repeat (LRR) protein
MAKSSLEIIVQVAGKPPERHLLAPGEYQIGRASSCQLRLEGEDVSRLHARLLVEADQWQIEDLGSTHGTLLNGEPLLGKQPVPSPATVRVGKAILEIKPLNKPASTASLQNRLQGPKYEAGQAIAEGGMGEVRTVHDLRLERVVAMKRMLPGIGASADGIRRFVQEARVLGRLEHPNIVPIHELGLDDQGEAFYTMKFVKGATLQFVLDGIKGGDPDTIARYPLAELLTIFRKLCDAVAFAHSRGILHRDLKPANIMLGDFGEVLVMDWGLAKILNEPAPNAATVAEVAPAAAAPTDDANRTMAGTIVGTPSFMAPEQAEGRVDQLDARTDIFALGGILYSLLTLRAPVSGQSMDEVLQKIRSGYIAPPVFFNQSPNMEPDGTVLGVPIVLAHCPGGKVSESLSAVAMKALAVKPEDRYQTVADLQKEIEAYHGGFATTAEEAGFWKQMDLLVRRRRTEFTLVAAAVVLLLAVAGGFMVKVLASEKRARLALARLQATAPSYFSLARSLIEERKFPEALDKISFALSLKPEEAPYHQLQGNVLQSQFQFQQAGAAYARALKLNPKQPFAADNLKLCQKLLTAGAEPGQPSATALEELRQAMLNQGRVAEALAIGGRAITSQASKLATWKAGLEKSGLKGTLRETAQGQLQLELSDPTLADLSVLKEIPLNILQLNGCANVADLTPLKNMPLTSLSFTGTRIHDLTPLQGLPLTQLRVYDETRTLTDISALRGMPLTLLYLYYTQVRDLSPLHGMPLQALYLAGGDFADISALQGLPLKELWLESSKVTDLSGLRGLPLTSLTFNTRATDLAPLKGAPLTFLRINSPGVFDLSPLTNMPLTELYLDGSKVTDLGPLRGMALFRLTISDTKVRDLGVFREASVDQLNLENSLVDDLSPLAGKPLGLLKIGGTKVSSLAPLASAQVGELYAGRTPIRNLEPLATMRVVILDVSDTLVTDLSPLARTGITELWLRNTRIRSVAPLKGLPLKRLQLERCVLLEDLSPLAECRELECLAIPVSLKNLEPLRQLPNLKRLGYGCELSHWELCPTAEEFWKAYDARKK